MPAPHTLTIPAHAAGWRLDRFLADYFELSRADVRRVLTAVQLDGRGARAGQRLAVGQTVTIEPEALRGLTHPVPEPASRLEVIHETADWLAVDKPAGQAVHPLAPGERGTVLNAMVARYPDIQGVGEGGLRSGVVHRLDVGTSGLVVFALHEEAWRRWRAAFAGHRLEKRYVGIVAGRVGHTAWQREAAWLKVTRHRPAHVSVVSPQTAGARECTLAWRALAHHEAGSWSASLVEVSLETGFLHQIRVMLAHRGHPIVGDPEYAPATPAPATPATTPAPASERAPRPMLHAADLDVPAGVVDPGSIALHSGLPADVGQVARDIGLRL